MNEILVIGLGNPLMADEGIGPRLVSELSGRGRLPPGVEAIDLGTSGFQVLHAITGRRRVIFIDCAYMDAPAGTIRRFTPEEVASKKIQTRLSLHEGDLLQTLKLSRQLGESPDDIIIFGIQPDSVECSDKLSTTLEARLEEYLDTITSELGS